MIIKGGRYEPDDEGDSDSEAAPSLPPPPKPPPAFFLVRSVGTSTLPVSSSRQTPPAAPETMEATRQDSAGRCEPVQGGRQLSADRQIGTSPAMASPGLFADRN